MAIKNTNKPTKSDGTTIHKSAETRVVRADEQKGHKPDARPVDWSQVSRPSGSAVKPPKK